MHEWDFQNSIIFLVPIINTALKQDETRAGRSDEENARGVQDDLDQKEPAALCSATVILENEEEAKAEEKIEMKETVDGNSKVVEEKVPLKNEDEQPLVCDNNRYSQLQLYTRCKLEFSLI